MVGVLVGSGVGVSVLAVLAALAAVSALGAVGVGATVVACPQAEKATDRNTKTNKNFFIT
jgi:hypothetical protein